VLLLCRNHNENCSHSMNFANVLFINCTLKPSPEISNTEALWSYLADRFCQLGCQVQQLRTIDLHILPGRTLEVGSGDEFSLIFEKIQNADILILGTPVWSGSRSSECQKLVERLQGAGQSQMDLTTGQSPLDNKIFGLLLVGEGTGSAYCAAQTCYDFSQMGCINPPHNTVTWSQPLGMETDCIEVKGKQVLAVNQAARLLGEYSVALAKMLNQNPVVIDRCETTIEAQQIVEGLEMPTLITPKTVSTKEHPLQDGIDYRRLTKRIWTVMAAGIRHGFEFKVLSVEDRIFRAEREGKGFTYKIYPGHFSFRRQYENYDYEQSKSRKLELMAEAGLAVPISYGVFKTVAEIPVDRLHLPLVVKPDSGSLSQNVFPNMQTAAQLQQAAAVIEVSGGVIKLESQIEGRDYRVLIINHQYAGCVERRPASVVGDGQSTILELFHQRNQEPGRGDYNDEHTTLHQLVFDQTSRRLLERAGYTLQTILPTGERFYLQEKITAVKGADYVDYTEQLHPSIIQACIEFSYQFSTLTLGFDLITTDISRPLDETGGAFNEYNFLPYVDLHEQCNVGQQRPVCRLIWDYIEDHRDQLVTSDFEVF